LGAQPATAGWSDAIIRPCPGDLQFARGQVPTPRGPIEIDWKKDSTFTLSLALPEGMSAQVELPAANGTTGVSVDGKSAEATKTENRWILKDKVSGAVNIEVN
jgi:hypothetical protein